MHQRVGASNVCKVCNPPAIVETDGHALLVFGMRECAAGPALREHGSGACY
jgi:hypothetical protein